MNRKDLWWILAYPIYQIIGTFRHEASHAIFAWLQGIGVKKFVILPSVVNGRFRWGYVVYDGRGDWLTAFAPYLVALVIILLTFFILQKVKFRRWVMINIFILGIISPVVDSLYNYFNGAVLGRGDVAQLLNMLPKMAVHGYFWGVLGASGFFIQKTSASVFNCSQTGNGTHVLSSFSCRQNGDNSR